MRNVLGVLWAAAASPRQFFERLETTPTRIVRAGGIAFTSILVLSSALALGVARATASDAWLPFAALALGSAVAFFLYAWAFGSAFVQRPGTLDARAWEVTGWSWTPALFGSLSLLIPLLAAPLVALPVLLVGVLGWHLVTLRTGLSVFLERPAHRAVTIYALSLYALPLLIFGLVVWLAGRLLS